VFRPFPEAAIGRALAGKKNVIILERTDECRAAPLRRRTALAFATSGPSIHWRLRVRRREAGAQGWEARGGWHSFFVLGIDPRTR
jgi:hypothetical protein